MAQEGDLYLFNYRPKVANSNYHNRAVAQDSQGIMYFANNHGIVSYDGVRWELINIHSTPYALSSSSKESKYIYVGSRGDFGFLKDHSNGEKVYQSLRKDLKDIGVINKILLGEKYIYFGGSKVVIQVARKNHRVLKVWRTKDRPFSGFFLLNKQLYANRAGRGIYKLNQDTWQKVSHGSRFAEVTLEGAVSYSGSQVLLGTSRSEFFLFSDQQVKPYHFEAESYVKDRLLSQAKSFSKEQMVISTLSGGCVLVDKKSGKTLSTINYFTGLPDDEVFSFNRDRDGSLWICHEYGLTRVNAALPVRNYSNYLGLEGNIISFAKLDTALYTATSEGLFFLSEATSQEEVSSLIRNFERVKQIQAYNKRIKAYQALLEKRQKEKKSFVGNVFGEVKELFDGDKNSDNPKKRERAAKKARKRYLKKVRKGEIKPAIVEYEAPDLTEANIDVDESDFYTLDAGEVYASEKIPFIYRQVEGIRGKCRQLIPYRDRLLVATNTGLYEVRGSAAELIIPGIYVNYIYQSSSQENRFWIATNSGVRSIEFQHGRWQSEKVYQNIDEEIYSIAQEGHLLWLGGENKVHKIVLNNRGEWQETQTYSFYEGYSREISIRVIEGQASFFFHDGVYRYDSDADELVKDTDLQRYYTLHSRVIFNQPGYTWTKGEDHWINVNRISELNAAQLLYLELFPGVQDIYADTDGHLWLVANNRLYRIDREANLDEKKPFTVFIRNVIDKQDRLLPLKGLVINQEDKSLSFRFRLASPFYLNEPDMRFSYWLEGLDEDWSSWNRQSTIAFPFLPSGNYRLHVRARNTFGQISEEKVFAFTITPPFWKTWWFFALQTLALLGLVFASFYFNHSGHSSLLSYILVFVTLITIFEFVVLLIEPYVDDVSGGVPIFKLGMNVALALSLAPIEKAVNRWAKRRRKRSIVTEVAPAQEEHRAV